MRTIIKKIKGENGKIYFVKKGERGLLAECDVYIDVIEEKIKIPCLGKCGGIVRKRKINIALCGEINFMREIGFEFFKDMPMFEICVDLQRLDGVFERINFDNISALDIDLDGEWKFEVMNDFKAEKYLGASKNPSNFIECKMIMAIFRACRELEKFSFVNFSRFP